MNLLEHMLPGRASAPIGGIPTALVRSSTLIAIVCVVGIGGYYVLSGPEYGLFDAVYMTAITLTTVGYGETIDMSSNHAARAFTVLLLVGGVGTFLYFFTAFTGFLVEGTLDRMFERRRMQRRIAALRDHFIVCGAGHTGQHVVEELVATRRPLVLIERDPDVARALHASVSGSVPYVVGDAADDETLTEAGIAHAAGVVACFSNDKDNLIVAFSARSLSPDVRIVCRSSDERVSAKMRLAGADAVVSPNTIGGVRMVSELTRPKAVSFLDQMLREHPDAFRLEDVTVAAGSPLAGLTLRDLRTETLADVLVVAVHMPDGSWRYNPDGNLRLDPGTSVVFIGDPELRARFAALAAPR